MKLFLFSDVHANAEFCFKIIERSNKADIVIGAGDIGHIRQKLPQTVTILRKIKKKIIFVPGNSESYDELKETCKDWKNATVLHGESVRFMGFDFFGIGGGIPVTPFGSWSWDLSEDQARILLNKCPQKSILISHSPPKGLLDVSSSGQSLGSEALKEILEVKKPLLVVCGHIHESSGQIIKYKETTVINAGPDGIYYEV